MSGKVKWSGLQLANRPVKFVKLYCVGDMYRAVDQL